MSDDTDIEELKEQTQKGSRVGAAAEQSEEKTDPLLEEYRDIVAGDSSITLSFRDEVIAGILNAAGDDEDLHHSIASPLQAELDNDVEHAGDRSELLRQLVRVGLRNAVPETAEEAREAYGQAVTEDAL